MRPGPWFSLLCPECGNETDTIRDGVCPACHYTLLGGDRAPDDLLRGVWEVTASRSENSQKEPT